MGSRRIVNNWAQSVQFELVASAPLAIMKSGTEDLSKAKTVSDGRV